MSATKSLLDTGKINAGQTIAANLGDVFNFGNGSDDNVILLLKPAARVNSETTSTTGTQSGWPLKVNIGAKLGPNVTIANDVELGNVAAISFEGLSQTAGNKAILDK